MPTKLNNGTIEAATNAAVTSSNKKNSIKKVRTMVFKKKVEIETVSIFTNAEMN